jgi:Uma2 family endonuclease
MSEVLPPGDRNEQRHREVRLKLYSRYTVQEYWIINWQLITLKIYRRAEAQLQMVGTLLIDDTLSSPLLPGFNTSIAEFFRLASTASFFGKTLGNRVQ